MKTENCLECGNKLYNLRSFLVCINCWQIEHKRLESESRKRFFAMLEKHVDSLSDNKEKKSNRDYGGLSC